MQKWNILYSSNDKIVWINYIDNEIKICYLTYKDEKTPLPKGWERWFSTTYQLFYYRYIDDNGREQIQWKSPKTSNQYNYSPKMKPSTVINLDLKDDLKKIYDMNGNVSLIYEGINIPCTINIHDTKIEIKIVGKEDDCLDFLMDNTTKNAYINLLAITDNECPLPEKLLHKGPFLLRMVDELCKQLQVKTLKLADASYITCKINGIKVSLEFQSLMKYGLSWYERNGFSYENKTKKDIVNNIRNTPISKIREFFSVLDKDLDNDIGQVELKSKCKRKDLENWYEKYPEFRNQEYVNSLEDVTERKLRMRRISFKTLITEDYDFSELPHKIKIMLDIISEYEKDKENTDSLSDFLTYLWDNNCSKYVEVMSVLYPKNGIRKYIDESILPDFPIYSYMIKVFEKAKEEIF